MYLKQLCYCKYLKKEENADMLKTCIFAHHDKKGYHRQRKANVSF